MERDRAGIAPIKDLVSLLIVIWSEPSSSPRNPGIDRLPATVAFIDNHDLVLDDLVLDLVLTLSVASILTVTTIESA